MAIDPLPRLRKLALDFPEAHEVEAWGTPTFRVRNKMFATYAPQGHHGEPRPNIWVKSLMENQQFMVAMDPGRYFVPPYVGVNGWVGMYLDRRVAWKEVATLLEDGYRMIAPKKLLPLLDDR